ncbi:MAG: type II toxin-antitoxin system RelE/ParE family toxin [Porphyrobacter sp.]|nr:type II toxin-antitoxin system RelE/ParE family toxin [Porphyrobacter sp.]
METTLLIAAAYLAATLTASRLLTNARLKHPVVSWKNLAAGVLLLFWPIWAPLILYRRFTAHLAKPAFLEKLRELDDLTAQYHFLVRQVDELLERLADAGDEPPTAALLEDLAATTRARQETQNHFAQIRDQARSIYSEHQSWWDLEAPGTLPEVGGRTDAAGVAVEEGVSRIRLHIYSDDEESGDWDLESALRDLQKHLSGLDRPGLAASGRGAAFSLVRYMRTGPARSRTWETVFTSSFRKSLKKVGRDIERKTIAAIAELAVNPVEPRGSTIMPLTGNHKGLWRYRIGEFRLIYQPLADEGELRLISLTHRSEAY